MEAIGNQSSKNQRGDDFITAAQRRWRQLAQELQTDVAEFNSSQGGADFSEVSSSRFRVTNLTTGLELVISADFESRVIQYNYQQVNDKSAGAPEGGMLSMRQSQIGAVEFYSADEQLTSEETREILLEPVLFP